MGDSVMEYVRARRRLARARIASREVVWMMPWLVVH